jgi:hypothetical protein
MAVLDGITGMATIGAGTIGDIQIIITTETMLITPAEEAHANNNTVDRTTQIILEVKEITPLDEL